MSGQKPYVIVYAEGGGVKGLIPLHILSRMREERGSHFMNGTDCLAGPSTGSIYLSGFNRPSEDDPTQPFWTEPQMVENYETCCPKIFHLHARNRHAFGMIADNAPKALSHMGFIRQNHKYNPAILEGFMKQLLGDMKVRDGLRSQLIAAKDFQGQNVRFQHIEESPSNDVYSDIELYKAVTASSMHPLCYPSYPIEMGGRRFNFLDGGLFEHPYHIYSEMRRTLPTGTPIHMVLLHAGKEKPKAVAPEFFNDLGLKGVFHHQHGMPLATEHVSATYAENLKNLRAELGDRLTEINFDMNRFFDADKIPLLDEATPEILSRYADIAEVTYREERSTMDKLKDLLNRREDAIDSPSYEVSASFYAVQSSWGGGVSVQPDFVPEAQKAPAIVTSEQKGFLSHLFPFLQRKKAEVPRPVNSAPQASATAGLPAMVHLPEVR